MYDCYRSFFQDYDAQQVEESQGHLNKCLINSIFAPRIIDRGNKSSLFLLYVTKHSGISYRITYTHRL